MNNLKPYRGKGIYTGKWEKGYLLDEIYGGQPIIITSSELNDGNYVEIEYEHIVPETKGRNTFLKDIKKTEIFEGDIVAFEDAECDAEGYHDNVFMNRGTVYIDSWNGVSFSNRQTVNMEDLYEDETTINCTVIGNIFDNPELLAE